VPNEYAALTFTIFGAAATLAVWLFAPAHIRDGMTILAGFLTFLTALVSIAEFRRK
jgi:hypothetical protein